MITVAVQYMPRPISNPNLTKWETYDGVADVCEVTEGFVRYLRIRFTDPTKPDFSWNMECVKKWEVKDL